MALTKNNPPRGTDLTRFTKHPSSFTLFPKLPTELRLRILRFAAQAPRMVQISRESGCWKAQDKRTKPVPSLLHVSRESRKEILKVYELYFCPYNIYFNFEYDIFGLGGLDKPVLYTGLHEFCSLFDKMKSKDLSRVRYLAIGANLFVGYSEVKWCLLDFPALQQFTVFDDTSGYPGGERRAWESLNRFVERQLDYMKWQTPSWEVPPWGIAGLTDDGLKMIEL